MGPRKNIELFGYYGAVLVWIGLNRIVMVLSRSCKDRLPASRKRRQFSASCVASLSPKSTQLWRSHLLTIGRISTTSHRDLHSTISHPNPYQQTRLAKVGL
jgi:hypothetical protein